MTTLPPQPTFTSQWFQLDEHYVNNFKFQPGVTPFSTYGSVITVIFAYMLLVVALKHHVAARGKTYDLRWAAIAWNVCLAIFSAVMLFMLGAEVFTLYNKTTFWDVLCDPKAQHTKGATKLLLTWVYWSKIVELFDTFMLCLRGIRVWWKSYLTLAQVSQFQVVLFFTAVLLIPRAIYDLVPDSAYGSSCTGSWHAVGVGMPLQLSYLYLFQRLYNQRYTYKNKKGSSEQLTDKNPSNNQQYPTRKSAMDTAMRIFRQRKLTSATSPLKSALSRKASDTTLPQSHPKKVHFKFDHVQ